MEKKTARLTVIGLLAIGGATGIAAWVLQSSDEPAQDSKQLVTTQKANPSEVPFEKINESSTIEGTPAKPFAEDLQDPVFEQLPAEDKFTLRSDLISPAARRRAEFFIGMMEQAVQSGMAGRWMRDNNPEERTKKVADALTLRLSLTNEQRAAVEGILLENMKARQDPFRSQPDLVRELLQNNRSLVVEGTALRVMERDGDLSAEQEAYGDEINAEFTSLLGFDPRAHESVPRWLESEETLAVMGENLAPEQKDELDLYIEDTLVREREQDAFRKSNRLATQLGLSNQDRDSLYEFYYENPDASDEELKEILHPSAHPFLDQERDRRF